MQEPLVAAYCTKNTCVMPDHTEILLKDHTGSFKENKVWGSDPAKVVRQNEGKGYLEIDNYHLILDIDYKKIVKLIKDFASNIQAFKIKEQSVLVRSNFYRATNIVQTFLGSLLRVYSKLVDLVTAAVKGQVEPSEALEEKEVLFAAISSMLDEFKDVYSWCKEAFPASKRDALEEGSDFEINYHQIILREFEAVIDPFMKNLAESISSSSFVVDQVVRVLSELSKAEAVLGLVYSHYSDILEMAKSSASLSQGQVDHLLSQLELDEISRKNLKPKFQLAPNKKNLLVQAVAALGPKVDARKLALLSKVDVCRNLVTQCRHLSVSKGSSVATPEERDKIYDVLNSVDAYLINLGRTLENLKKVELVTGSLN